MKYRTIFGLSLASLLSCNKYPQDANLLVEADNASYLIYAESEGKRYYIGNQKNNPRWVYHDLAPKVRVRITVNDSEIYNGLFLDDRSKFIAPSLPELLDKSGTIGAGCGFHHPDSLESCWAERKVDGPVLVAYEISPFPGEKKSDDNQVSVVLTTNDLDGNARALYSQWIEKNQR